MRLGATFDSLDSKVSICQDYCTYPPDAIELNVRCCASLLHVHLYLLQLRLPVGWSHHASACRVTDLHQPLKPIHALHLRHTVLTRPTTCKPMNLTTQPILHPS